MHKFKRQLFLFHNLTFMVSVKVIVLFNFIFGATSFSVHISFMKCKYFSLLCSFLIDCKPLMKAKGNKLTKCMYALLHVMIISHFSPF